VATDVPRQINRPNSPYSDLGGLDWMANDQGFSARTSRPIGAVEGVLAIQFGPIMAVLPRWVASVVSMGAVLYPATTQDPERGSWTDCSGESTERADLDGNGPTYLAPDNRFAHMHDMRMCVPWCCLSDVNRQVL
jgi:hypothetical protein